jgi:hypothetical protein
VAVPSPLSANATPEGSEPAGMDRAVSAGKSWPVLTVALPAEPAVKVTAAGLVIDGAS